MMFSRLTALFAGAFAVVAATTAPSAAAFERKVALVIGNGAYENAAALANPVRDAKAMAGVLSGLGFDVVEGYDLSRDGLYGTLRTFAREASEADLTLFFYAGHGIGYAGRNYLVPVDARFEDATALDFEALPVDFVTKQMRYNDGVSLVILDACRDNPLAGTLTRSLGEQTRSAVTRGLADMTLSEAGRGLAIAFATAPGEVAYDGAGDHSPFTSALLTHLDAPGTDFTEVMSRVTGEVLETTDDRQRPWINASLTGPVILNPGPKADTLAAVGSVSGTQPGGAAPAPASLAPRSADLEAQTLLFNLARQSGKRADYEAYLATFPDGLYAYNAREAMRALTGESRTAGAPKADEIAEEPQPLEFAALTPSRETVAEGEPDAAAATDDEAGDAAANAEPAVDAKEPAAVAHETPATVEVPVSQDAVAITEATPDATPEPTTQAAEAELGLSREDRREIQVRLNLAGHDVGGADGIFGPMTRAGIEAFQEAQGLAVTGFLGAAQVAALTTQTEPAYAAHQAQQAQARAAARERERQRRAAQPRRTRKASTAPRRAATSKPAARKTTRRRAARATQRRSAPAAQRKTVQRTRPKATAKSDLNTAAGWRNRRRLTPAQMNAAARAARQANLPQAKRR